MDINYAELYGVKPNESDFSGAIERSLSKDVQHLSKKYLQTIINMRKERKKK